jgi:hypothetical protein
VSFICFFVVQHCIFKCWYTAIFADFIGQGFSSGLHHFSTSKPLSVDHFPATLDKLPQLVLLIPSQPHKPSLSVQLYSIRLHHPLHPGTAQTSRITGYCDPSSHITISTWSQFSPSLQSVSASLHQLLQSHMDLCPYGTCLSIAEPGPHLPHLDGFATITWPSAPMSLQPQPLQAAASTLEWSILGCRRLVWCIWFVAFHGH